MEPPVSPRREPMLRALGRSTLLQHPYGGAPDRPSQLGGTDGNLRQSASSAQAASISSCSAARCTPGNAACHHTSSGASAGRS